MNGTEQQPASSESVRLRLPALFSTDLVADRNRARQMLIPAQEVKASAVDGAYVFRLADARRFRIVRRRGKTVDPERSFLVPSAVEIRSGADLNEIATAKWLPSRAIDAPERVLESLVGAFKFVEEDPDSGRHGLRTPQVGALHAVLGYWTTDPAHPATVVMPTGTGKTETMLALFAERRISRLLVIVPSDALRSQVARKFESYGVLQELGVVDSHARRPVVGQIRHSFRSIDAAKDFADVCNVVVATPQALNASSSEAQLALMEECSHLFVDEAHHVAAATWRAIRDAFGKKPVVQFTATPFREDGRHLGGRMIYAFPLREAQRQGYFSEIDYLSVVEFDAPDRAIAEKAVERLRADLAAGYDHLLMARVKRIGRAEEVADIYREIAPELAPVIVHSNMTATARREALEAMTARATRVIVCVDMLGEGFDLAPLKVAAIHDPHKSLGVTLQFVGRFTRVAGDSVGRACVVVGRPELDYDDNLRRLYSEDADWNHLIRDLSEKAVGGEEEASEFEAGFAELPEEVSLHSLLPKMSTVVYRTQCSDWHPEHILDLFPEEEFYTSLSVNSAEHVAWFVRQRRGEVRWGEIRTIEEVSYDLYVLYWDASRGLLYVNSSDTQSLHEDLAKSVADETVERFKGENVYRVMAQVQRLVPTNVGVLDVRNRARRFSMHVGADVSEGFPIAEAQTKTKTNIFAYGFEDGSRVSIGASLKGRVWSHRVATSIKQWVDWCDYVGGKLTNNQISVDDVMRNFIRPQVVEERPSLVALGLEWPWEVFLSTSEELRVSHNGSSWPLVDAELQLTNFGDEGPIVFKIVTPEWSVDYESTFTPNNIEYRPLGSDVSVGTRRSSGQLSTFLNKNGLTILFEKDATVVPPGILLQPNRDVPPFDLDRLHALGWQGIDIRKESQGAQRAADSIQARAIQHLLDTDEWDLIIDDDGCGEIADIVAMKATDDELHVHLVHCKYSHGDTPGARLVDLYEVCGQAQKSSRWRRNIDYMFRHLIRREKTRAQRFGRSGVVHGQPSTLYELEDRSRLLKPVVSVAIVQPGLSKAQASDQQLELLGSTELYLHETALAELSILCSP